MVDFVGLVRRRSRVRSQTLPFSLRFFSFLSFFFFFFFSFSFYFRSNSFVMFLYIAYNFLDLQIFFSALLAVPRGVLLGILSGGACAARFSKSWPYFRPKNVIPHPFSDQTSKIHTRFQTLPLGKNYVIITQLREQTKNFLKRISNLGISIQLFLFIWNWNDKYVRTLPYFPRKPYPIPDHNGKVYTCIQTKTAQNPYPLWRHKSTWLI